MKPNRRSDLECGGLTALWIMPHGNSSTVFPVRPSSKAASGRRTPNIAFTLVELLVSMAVLSLLVLSLGQVLSNVSSAWSLGEGNAERRRGARAIADFIGAELQGAMLPVETLDPKNHGNLQFLVNPPATRLSADYRHADALFWQAPLATESSYGEIACVGYFVKWEGSLPMLCRFFINPSVTNSGVVTPNPLFRLYEANPDAWLDTSIVEQAVAPGDKTQGYKGLFAEYVLGLWVRCYGLNGQALPSTFDSRQGYDYTYSSPSGTYTEKRHLPATVKVSLAQIDSRHAFQLSQCASEIKALVTATGINNAHDFMSALQQAASTSKPLAQLLPAVRIYSTEIKLHNAQ